MPVLPGCIREGDTKGEALRNIREAIDSYLEPVEDDVTSEPKAELVDLIV
jgi:predicted RNase H-like HicB family nuclease